MKREPRRRHFWMVSAAETRHPGAEASSAGDATSFHDDTTVVHNDGDHPAHCEITLYFEDREPVGPYRLRVDARDSMRLRLRPGGRGTGNCRGLLVSDVPVVLETLDQLPQAAD